MGQQMTHRQFGSNHRILHREVRKVISNWKIERELSLFDQAHHGRRRESLGGGSDLEQRIFIDGKWMAYAGEAEPAGEFASVTGYAQRDAGNFVPLHRGRYQLAYGVEQLFCTRRFAHGKARRIETFRFVALFVTRFSTAGNPLFGLGANQVRLGKCSASLQSATEIHPGT
jgi:hypothetical protein